MILKYYYCVTVFFSPSADLRRALVTQLKPYTRKVTLTGKELGNGTYGKVIELKSFRPKEILAGKIFRMSSNACDLSVAIRIYRELNTMMPLDHPNIVLCKGVTLLTDQPLPVLLMERLAFSLYDYLVKHNDSYLSVEKKLSFLHDIANGLNYLHSRTPAIIHRDLTAKNILLDSHLTAKIADFGNCRIMDLDPEASPERLSSLPGTLEYMPPEALGCINTNYGPSLDVFSFGHLGLFTLTQRRIHLLPPTYHDPSRGEVCARSEVQRRERFVKVAEQMSVNPLLMEVIKHCLHNNPALRPRTGELPKNLQVIAGECKWQCHPHSYSLFPLIYLKIIRFSLCRW